ncbi:putative quinol monooxygenase [Cognatiyoonia sp. IB215182]|uniref:putative quinol monooxygenase n=1 Tax=Cognatiyoonia sp. IB215182 TaxID=3097353 RepID=UPI002A0C79E0|nr:putative quinol monooxygenase [Cognatiyoonia sp. IB215182]MDX8354118.1 putative quinol monooxygenase [Cognatiyoonia sp. IB215182]
MYAVCVTLTLKPGKADEFMPLMLENARISLRDEPDCHQFSVATNSQEPEAVFLYELYSDSAAFDAHLTSAHFRAFDTATNDLVAERTVHTWDRVLK